MPCHPVVRLDTTLADLYKRSGPTYGDKKIGQVLCGASSGINLNKRFPRNKRYIYQDGTFNALSTDQNKQNDTELARSAAIKYLALVPQREAFIAGQTTVFFFSVDASPEQIEHVHNEFNNTLAALTDDQRPNLILAPGPEHISLEDGCVDVLAQKVLIGALDAYSSVCRLDDQYYLNTKEALVTSGLPTPTGDVVLLEGYCPSVAECCDKCASEDILWINPRCTGTRGQWLTKSEEAVVQAIRSRNLPFVVKGTQTFGGAGTWLVNTEQDRKTVISDLKGGILHKLFSLVTPQNQHLKPGSIILSDMIRDPISNSGLTMFVRENGSPEILGVSEQVIDGSAWIESTITYSKQTTLIKKFDEIAKKIAAWAHKHEYIGPVGADILETTPPDTGSSQFYIVDLNMRTSGSMCLPLLSNHFTQQGYDCASVSNISVKKSRTEFLEQWSSLFDNGQACILGWYEDRYTGVSLADVALAEKDEASLQELMQKVKDSTDSVKF